MSMTLTRTTPLSATRGVVLAGLAVAALVLSARPANAQSRDSLVNGAVIGAAIGAGTGVAFTYAVRDSDLVFSQYARGALVFGAIGAGVGLGIDALLHRTAGPRMTPRRVVITPTVWRDVSRVAVMWRW